MLSPGHLGGTWEAPGATGRASASRERQTGEEHTCPRGAGPPCRGAGGLPALVTASSSSEVFPSGTGGEQGQQTRVSRETLGSAPGAPNKPPPPPADRLPAPAPSSGLGLVPVRPARLDACPAPGFGVRSVGWSVGVGQAWVSVAGGCLASVGHLSQLSGRSVAGTPTWFEGRLVPLREGPETEPVQPGPWICPHLTMKAGTPSPARTVLPA